MFRRRGPGPEPDWHNLTLNAIFRAERSGNPADARKAVELVLAALAATANIRAAQWVLTSRLGSALGLLYQMTSDPPVLDDAIQVFKSWLATFPDFEHLPEYPESRDVVLDNLTTLLFERYRTRTDRQSWGELAWVLRARVAAHPDEVTTKHKLGSALLLGYEDFRELDMAVEGVDVLRDVVAATPPESPDRPIALIDLGLVLRRMAARTRDLALAREAVDVHRQALDAFPVEHPRRSLYVSSVASALGVLYDHTHDLDTLRERIDLLRQTMAMTTDNLKYGLWLGGSLATLFEHTGDTAALDEGIALMRRGLPAAPEHTPERRDYEVRFATALIAKGDVSGLDLLDQAATHLRAALDGMSPDDPNLVPTATELHKILHDKTSWTGDPGPVTESVAVLRRAVEPSRPDPYLHAAVLAMLGGELYTLYEVAGGKAVLDEGIALMRESLTLIPAEDSLHAVCRTNLSDALQLRGEGTNNLADIEEAIELARGTVVGGDAGELDHQLTTLASGLFRRYDRAGALTDLDEAIALYQRVVDRGLGQPHEVATHLIEYGRLRHRRYTATNAIEDLDATIAASRAATDLLVPEHRNWARARQVLTLALLDRFNRTEDTGALAEAVDLSAAALAAMPETNPYRATYLAARALVLSASNRHTPDRSNLDEAIACGSAAIASNPDGHANEAVFLANHAGDLRTRFEHRGDPRDLLAARDLLRRAAALVPEDRPRWAQLHYSLGSVLAAVHDATGERAALDEAAAAHRAAVESAAASTDVRAQAGIGLADVHMRQGEPARAADAYAAVVGLLPGIAARSLLRGDAEESLRRFASVGRDGAACAVAAGRPELAATLLETGRGVLVAQALESRRDLTELRAHTPELADRFERLNRELDASHEVSALDRRRELDRELNALVTRIRAIPGFAGFLSPPTVDELLTHTSDGPIAQINVSRHRCDAIVLTADGIRTVPLPALSDEQVVARTIEFILAIDTVHHAGKGFADRWQAQQTVERTLAWLWDTIAEPVLDTLGVSDGQRVWWSAVGPLSFLPLHAAGHHDQPARTVLDRVVSSYTPTVRALAHARRPVRSSRARQRMLVVAMPTTPNGADLPGATREAQLLTDHFTEATLLEGPRATRTAVLEALTAIECAHFVCHGHSDPTNPSTSRFLLHDHAEQPLTALDLSRLHLDSAELAFLSACDTSRASPTLPDEAIHLTTSCQLAGFRHVIGTLWTIDDAVAVEFADRIYGELGTSQDGLDTSRTADAVHRATRALRDRYPKAPSLWAAHVYAGA